MAIEKSFKRLIETLCEDVLICEKCHCIHARLLLLRDGEIVSPQLMLDTILSGDAAQIQLDHLKVVRIGREIRLERPRNVILFELIDLFEEQHEVARRPGGDDMNYCWKPAGAEQGSWKYGL